MSLSEFSYLLETFYHEQFQPPPPEGSLEDTHIVNISRRIETQEILRCLSAALNVETFDVNRIITDSRDRMFKSTFNVIDTLRKSLENDRQALEVLWEALYSCGCASIANQVLKND